jgi:hypothetical protein
MPLWLFSTSFLVYNPSPISLDRHAYAYSGFFAHEEPLSCKNRILSPGPSLKSAILNQTTRFVRAHVLSKIKMERAKNGQETTALLTMLRQFGSKSQLTKILILRDGCP